MHVLSLPLRVPVSKNKDFILNLNNYRNAHYQTLNKAKVNFKEAVAPDVERLPKMHRVHLHYTLYPGTSRLTDVNNVVSIVDKFFADALVELGKIPDDNYTVVPTSSSEFGKIDRDNPRVDVEISELEMKIVLEEEEVRAIIADQVEAAVSSHVCTTLGVTPDALDIEVLDDGSAEVTIGAATGAKKAAPKKKAPAKKKAAPAKVKATTVEEVVEKADVATNESVEQTDATPLEAATGDDEDELLKSLSGGSDAPVADTEEAAEASDELVIGDGNDSAPAVIFDFDN